MVELGVVAFILAVIGVSIFLWVRSKGSAGVLIWGLAGSIFLLTLGMVLNDSITYNKTTVVKVLDNGTLQNLGDVVQTTSVFQGVLPNLVFISGVVVFFITFAAFVRLYFRSMYEKRRERERKEKEEEYGISGLFE